MEESFDLGPLTWVKGELDTALAAARTGLVAWRGEETAPLRTAAAHLHQVYGAFQIVDLQGVAMLTGEIERLLIEMEAKPVLLIQANAALAIQAIDALKEYLDDLMAGGRNSEVRLTPLYQQLVAARGGGAPAPSELFYPDTSLRVPRREAEPPMEDSARARAIRAARARYQRGLVQYLQGKGADAGLLAMDQAVKEVEKLAPGPAQYSFWWTAGAFMEGLRQPGRSADFWQKRLCGRIDLQMRRLMEGSRQLADRLFRDVLFYVAQDGNLSGRAAETRDLYQLDRLLPAAVAPKPGNTSQLGQLKDQLKSAKEHWLRCCSGQQESLGAFQAATLGVYEAAAHLPNASLQSLTRMLQAIAKRMPNVDTAVRNEALQLELATTILLMQNATDHFDGLGDEFRRQAEVLAMRLQGAIDPKFDTSRIPQVDLLDEISRTAQEKLLLAQVTREIQNNLNQIEEVLDKFFRNPAHREGLPQVPSLIKQIMGALNILQLDVARDLLKECARRIGHFNEGDTYITEDNLNWVAEALSTLGLYVEALRFGKDDTQALASLLSVPELAPGQEQTVEAQIREETAHIRDNLQTLADGRSLGEADKAVVTQQLNQLARDADLVGDTNLRGQADAALHALEAAAPEAALQAIQVVAPAPATPSAEVQRLAAAPTEEVDRELLGIYIEEANEVLGTIAIQVSRLQVSPYDKEAFTTVRRSFHTLKGSGRMVGLTDLGEAAWEVEQTLNQWLRDERPPTPDMLNFLESCGNAFQGWVNQLEDRGRALVDSDFLVAGARRLRGEVEQATADSPRQEPPRPKDEGGAPEPVAAPPAPAPLEHLDTLEEIDPHEVPDVLEPFDLLASELFSEGAFEAPTLDPLPDPLPMEPALDGLMLELTNPASTSVETEQMEPSDQESTESDWYQPNQPEPSVDAPVEPVMDDNVDIDGHILPAALYDIFVGEAIQRLADLQQALNGMASPFPGESWERFTRAAHTLAGISRTTGFTPLADIAYELECWAGAWPATAVALPGEAVHALDQALCALTDGVEQIVARHFPLLDGQGFTPPPLPGPITEPTSTSEPTPELVAEIPIESDLIESNPSNALNLSADIAPAWALDLVPIAPQGGGSSLDTGAVVDDIFQAPEFPPEPEPVALEEAAPAWALDVTETALGGSEPEPIPVLAATPDPEPDPDPTPATVSNPANVSTRIPPPSAQAQVQDDLDADLLPIFLEEADDLLPKMGSGLRAWRAHIPGAVDDLKRVLHTLKGSARMAGAMNLGEAVHVMESHVVAVGDELQDEAQLDNFEAQYDGIAEAIERLKRGESSVILPAPPTAEVSEPVLVAAQEAPKDAPAPTPQAVHQREEHAATPPPVLEELHRQRQSLRVDSEVMDTLLNEAGELAIARSRIENVLSGYKQTAQELASNVERLRSQLRELDIQAESQMRSQLSHLDETRFDPLEFDRFTRLQELTRQLAESVDDVSTAQSNLLSGLTEADNALTVQARMARTLQQELMSIRLLPLSSLEERLHRVVRQAARDAGKRARLELSGGHTDVDRGVLDKITAPLEHLVRNAVAHGLESPERRIALGKPEQGLVRLSARQEGSEIVLQLTDDGAGIDLDKVRAKAIQSGLLSPEQDAPAELLEQLLFRSGFTTAQQVTELAGRGVGLDVVKNEIAGVGGRVRLDNQPGQGAKFTIRLPLTLALSQVVMARAGGQLWALPVDLVALVREVRAEQLHDLQAAGYVELGSESFPLRGLSELLGRTSAPPEGRYRTLLLLRAGDQRLALRVDGLEGNFEAVLKPIGPQLARIAGVSGATVLADGRVALIINPFHLAERMAQFSMPVVVEEELESALVMVVDDSLTVRKIATRFLQREGFRVITARDGQEALEMLEEEIPDLMLLDIEMPRMDGFEVAHHVRASGRTRDLPIIMITSRTADKHRDHAFSLGVNAYMGKPYVEEELLVEMRRLLQREAVAV